MGLHTQENQNEAVVEQLSHNTKLIDMHILFIYVLENVRF